MHQYDDGLEYGQGGYSQLGCSCHLIERDIQPSNQSRRFRPRLKMTNPPGARMLVQVHPETIEVFDMKGVYLCQVRLIRGVMSYTQGGLPLKELEEMFQEE